MKTSLIKKTARTFFLVQAVMLVTSCSNFLNIDNYFDDEFNIDSVFTNARYMEAYMWGAAAMFPDEAQTIRNGYTPGPMATDEGFNGLTGSGTANIYHGMDFCQRKRHTGFPRRRLHQPEPMGQILQKLSVSATASCKTSTARKT